MIRQSLLFAMFTTIFFAVARAMAVSFKIPQASLQFNNTIVSILKLAASSQAQSGVLAGAIRIPSTWALDLISQTILCCQATWTTIII